MIGLCGLKGRTNELIVNYLIYKHKYIPYFPVDWHRLPHKKDNMLVTYLPNKKQVKLFRYYGGTVIGIPYTHTHFPKYCDAIVLPNSDARTVCDEVDVILRHLFYKNV